MYLKRLLLLLAVSICGLPGVLMAQSEPDLLLFELPTSFLNPVGAGARAAGTGFAFISVADDATAASHNPAGLAQLVAPEISIVGSHLMRSERPDGSSEIETQDLRNPSLLNFLSIVAPPIDLGRKVVVSLHMHRAFELKDTLDLSTDLSRLKAISGKEVTFQADDIGLIKMSYLGNVGSRFNRTSTAAIAD